MWLWFLTQGVSVCVCRSKDLPILCMHDCSSNLDIRDAIHREERRVWKTVLLQFSVILSFNPVGQSCHSAAVATQAWGGGCMLWHPCRSGIKCARSNFISESDIKWKGHFGRNYKWQTSIEHDLDIDLEASKSVVVHIGMNTTSMTCMASQILRADRWIK